MIFTFRIDKTKQQLHNRKTEYFKALSKNDHSSAADHVNATRHNKWDHLEILASGKSDYIIARSKETLFTQDLKSALNVNIMSSEKLISRLY